MSHRYKKEMQRYVSGNSFQLPLKKIERFSDMTAEKYINAIFEIIDDDIRKNPGKNMNLINQAIESIKSIASRYTIDRSFVDARLSKIVAHLNTCSVENKTISSKKVDKFANRVEELKEDLDNSEKEWFTYLTKILDRKEKLEDLRTCFKEIFKIFPEQINCQSLDKTTIFEYLYEKTLKVALNKEKNVENYKNLIDLFKGYKSFKLSEESKNNISYIAEKYKDEACKLYYKSENSREICKEISAITKKALQTRNKTTSLNELATRFGLQIDFKAKIKDISHKVIDLAKDDKEIRVISNWNISIDAQGAKVIDDIVYCKKLDNGNYEVGVSIASVLSYMDFSSDAVQEAISRGCTIYLKKASGKDHDMIPMLPEKFITQASLQEGEPKSARTYIFEINNSGEVVRKEFVRSLVTNDEQLTLTEAMSKLSKKEKTTNTEITLQNLEEVTKLISRKYSDKFEYAEKKEKRPDPTRLKEEASSRNQAGIIVSTLMNLVNTEVAKWFKENNYPFIYRTRQEQDEDEKEDKKIIEEELIKHRFNDQRINKLNQIVESKLSESFYSTRPVHSGKNSNVSSHCTSELRRAADIVNEHLLREIYDAVNSGVEISKKDLETLKNQVEEYCLYLNRKNCTIDNMIQDNERTNKIKKSKKEKLKRQRIRKKYQ